MTEATASYLRVAEVAQILRVSQSKVWALIWNGTLPSVRIGERSVRVPRDRLEAWLAELAEHTRVGAA